jgi:amino acid adenylation domain-containing protein
MDERVLIVDPESLQPCPPNHVGEIWVSSPSVAKGYWNRPLETEETFHAYLTETGEGPFLRTRDLGYLRNGELFITGRRDDLIIIRGRNHYPQDIELTVERSHAALRPGSGAAFAIEVLGEEQLVVVQELNHRQCPDTGSVIEAIRQSLSDHHGVQAHAVLLVRNGNVPKTSSGKIQRQACRTKFLEGRLEIIAEWHGRVALQTATFGLASTPLLEDTEAIEAWLVSQIAGRLGFDASHIEVHQPITRYGIDSLTAIELMHSIEMSLGLRLPMSGFLESRSIAQLAAQAVDQFKAGSSITAAGLAASHELNGGQPLSHGQQGLWFLHQLAPESPAYNIAIAAHVSSSLDPAALRRAFQSLVNRHPSLRTTFKAVEGEPVQEIQSHAEVSFSEADASNLAEAALNDRLVKEAHAPFDLERGPLLRINLFRRAEEKHVLLLVIHHIVADFWSLAVMIDELGQLYEAEKSGTTASLAPPPLPFTAYARWQTQMLQSDEGQRSQAYWKKQLADELPVLNLPADRPRPLVQTYRGASQSLKLSAELTRQLKLLSRNCETTLYMTLLAAFEILLYRYTGQDKFLIGSPTAGRNRAELAGVIGYFVNPLVLRADLSNDPTAEQLLSRVRLTVLEAFEHQDYPFALLVEQLQPERDPGRSPLFDVAFILQKAQLSSGEDISSLALGEAGASVKIGNLELEPLALEQQIAQFDLTLMMAEVEGGITFSLQYNTDLFDASTIKRMTEHLETLLAGIIAHPEERISRLPLLSDREQQQLLAEWNDTATEYPREQCLHQLFEAQVERTPDAVAIVFENQELSYRELNTKANQLAHYLRRLGVGPEVLVGISMHRSIEMVVSLLAVLKAGGAYVPLDPEYPAERVRFMLEDAAARVLLTQSPLLERLPAHSATVISVDTEWEVIEEEKIENPEAEIRAENVAYVIYTSGSTGRPKGVMIEHHSAASFLQWARKAFAPEELAAVLASTSICFDLSVFELFVPLSYGHKVVLAENALHLPSLRAAQEVTLINTVPSAIAALIKVDGIPASVRTVNLAGEPLTNALAQRLYQQSGVERVFNLYGPSEGTTYSTYTLVKRDAHEAPTIGRPVGNTQVYILDKYLQPVPIGIIGELYIGGEGVARGYLNRAGLTADRFVAHPLSNEPGGRLYRTGDMARYRANGEVEFLGRLDYQVKIRGFRIELGEIETALREHASVRDAVVLSHEDPNGDKRLVAYLVVSQAQARISGELSAFLKRKLPGYMVPSSYVFLDELPLTPNGKLDRRALPLPEQTESRAEFVAPRTPTEELLSGIFSKVLRLSTVGIHDNFFESGGHSLLATQLISRVRDLFRVEIALRALFEHPTVAALAESVEAALHGRAEETALPLQRVSRDEPLPLSFAQQRLWFIDQFEPDTSLYNMPASMRLAGHLDLDALRQAFSEVVRRHEILRTVFADVDGTPVQLIQPAAPLMLPVIDLSRLADADREAELVRLTAQESQRPFDLSRGPLFRINLLKLSEDEHIILLTMHHIVSDGWSMSVLVREVAALYQAFSAGQPSPLPELAIQYADYASWQREYLQGEVLENQLAYWRQQLGGELPVLELPADHPYPPARSYRGGRTSFSLTAEVTEQLKALSRQHGVTLYMTLLAAFQLLLSRYGGQTDVAVGTPVAGRTRAETEELIGVFVNTLVMRTDLSGNPSFPELLRRVREVCLGAYAHQDVPFEKLVEELQPERSLSRTPLFQVMMALQNAAMETPALPGLTASVAAVQSETTKFDLILEMVEDGDRLLASLDYSTDLFEEATILRLSGHFETLLKGIVDDPTASIASLPLLGESERQQLLEEWNDTGRPYPREQCIHHLFEEQVERAPEAIAVVYEDQQLTYRELNSKANQLAHHLRKLGVGPEVLVGICMERSVEMVVSLLAVLKAGGAYLPLDPEYPAARISLMAEDAAVPVVLTQERLTEQLPALSAQVVCVDTAREMLSQESVENPKAATSAENLAYVIYTSGSTGTPKGVLVPHRGVNRLVLNQNYARLTAHDRMAMTSNSAFDAATFELWGALLHGACLVVIGRDVLLSSERLIRLLEVQRVTVMFLATALFNQVAAAAPLAFKSLRYLFMGGEAFDPRWMRDVLEQGAPQHLLHMYGPTESTTYTTWYEVKEISRDARTVPIGKAIANTEVYVLDAHMQPVPIGVPGELYVGGDGLARGYLKRAALSAERFVPHPYSRNPGARLYRTGDLVRCLADGNIEFLGRLDRQVKLRGYRIELGEIEAVLNEHPAIEKAVVLAREDRPGDKRLVAYVVAAENAAAGDASLSRELRKYLKQKLPDYMIPGAFVMLAALPLTPNGKIDRAALPAPEQTTTELPEGAIAPRTPTEEIVVGIWSIVLGIGRVGVEDNFFELGGHSLRATQIVSRLREVFHLDLPLRAIFEHPTIAGLAERIDASMRIEQDVAESSIEPVSRERELPLSYAQQRLWLLDQLEPGNVAFNMPAIVRFKGRLNVSALEQALSEIIRRHEVLRTTIVASAEYPVQIISPPRPLSLPVLDLRGVAESERETLAQQLAEEEAGRPFDLARGPLLRANLLRLNEAEHTLLLTMHHIVNDGWSIQVLLREVKALYEAFSEGKPSPLPELPIQYADYAVWQREWLEGEVLKRQLDYWTRQLSGAPSMLQLPTDRPRPALQTFCGQSHTLFLGAELRELLKDLSRMENATLFMTLLSAFQILLQRYTGQDEIVVGTPIAGRNRPEIESLIGFFINSLALRCDLSGDPTFRQVIGQTREVTLGAYAHQDLPFEKILEELQPERSLGYTSLFQVFFNMLNLEIEQLELSGLNAEYVATTNVGSKFDLTLYVEERQDGISLHLVYNSDLFAHDRMVEMLEQYQQLLWQAVRSPDTRISHFSLLTPAEQTLLPDPAQPLNDDWRGSVHSLFSEHARLSPLHLAVVDQEEAWTYGELDCRSNQLANHLRSSGIGSGDIVAVYAHRSASLVWALLSIFKAGAAFVILDPAYPPSRLIEYLRLARPSGWIQIEEAGELPRELAEFASSLSLSCRLTLPRRSIAAQRNFLQQYSTQLQEVLTGPDDLAYLSFTSGTTGKPKGILGRHGSLTHFLPWLTEMFGFTESDKFSMLSGLSHDPLHRDIFTPLCLGGRICIPDSENIGRPGWLAQWMKREQVSIAHLTPAMGRLLTESVADDTGAEESNLRYVFFVGDILTQRDVSRFREFAPAATCVNFYGTTETQRAVGYYIVPNERATATSSVGAQRPVEKEIIPLGRGIGDVQLLILNANRRMAAISEIGEIYLRSPHLAKGYINDDALNGERFLLNPFTNEARDRLYKTGDLGRYLPDGNVEPAGRADFQVKIRGFRIELGEIEANINKHPSIRESVCLASEDQEGEKRLVAYLVAEANATVSEGEMREYLRQKLPDYMLPVSYLFLDKLPLTPNGKINRDALPRPEHSPFDSAWAEAAPRTRVEELLCNIWTELLRISHVGIHANFFELGGHSLLGVRLMSRLRREFEIELPLRALFESPTIAELASLIEQERKEQHSAAVVLSQIERRQSRTVEELLAELE